MSSVKLIDYNMQLNYDFVAYFYIFMQTKLIWFCHKQGFTFIIADFRKCNRSHITKFKED